MIKVARIGDAAAQCRATLYVAGVCKRQVQIFMDQVVGILIQMVLEVIGRITGRNILKFLGAHDPTERAQYTVGSIFWAIVAIATFIGLRSLT